ncbi:hypothetical protein LCGC14_2048730 [marine sediment metagenome]|uniref:Uncharacterized protein n=1 Tax=marine sediment metagenome TaxID=412755 RepID=A0A0F9HLL1_9ZZZZ
MVEEINEELTKKIIKLLEYEIENKKEASDKEIIRIAGIGIDELDEFKVPLMVIQRSIKWPRKR